MMTMRAKKGYFFILDALIGILIMSIAFVSILVEPVSVPQKSGLDMLAGDVQLFLDTTRMEELDIAVWTASENKKYTIMQQIGEYYETAEYGMAGQLIGATIGEIMPGQFNIEIAVIDKINGIEKILYQSIAAPKDKSGIVLIKKSIVFGMNAADYSLWGPYVVEVRMWE